MNRNVHQGSYGEGLVYALAAAAGLTASRPHLDVDGVDWLIARPGASGTIRSPKIEVQVKTWSQAGETVEHWQGRLDANHFNALAGAGFMVPRFLVAVVVPTDAADYADCDPARLALRHAAYWLSLADHDVLPSGDADRTRVQVRVPKRNLLTVATLTALVVGDIKGAVL